MRQRVGLAQAIVHDPEVLILDEPTIGLDPHQVQDVRALVRALGKTRTVLLSTHILPEAEQVCDRIIIIDRGRIVAIDTPDRLRDHLQRGAQVFIRVGGRADRRDIARLVRTVPGVTSVEPHADGYIIQVAPSSEIRPALASAVVGQGLELLELRPWAVTLEEIFLELTTRLDQPAPRSGGARRA